MIKNNENTFHGKHRVLSEYMKYLIFEIKLSKDLNNLSTNLFIVLRRTLLIKFQRLDNLFIL